MSVRFALRVGAPLACMLALSACGGGAAGSASGTATEVGPPTSGSTAPATTTNAIQLDATTHSVKQSDGSVTVTVNRAGGDTNATSVSYATANGTAVAGSDYTAISGTLTWGSGDTAAKTINIPVSNATAFSGNKTFGLALSNPASGASIGEPASTTITISGDLTTAPAPAPAGSLAFSAASYSVSQALGTVSVSVKRTGGTAGAIQVSYSTTADTAIAGTNFTAASGTLTWSDGDSSAKSVAIAISASAVFSGTRSFGVALTAPTGGATLGTPNVATVAITGSAVATGAPSAVSNLQLINQGGTDNVNNPVKNSQTISWTAAAAGAAAIDHYKIYRNGTAYATTKATTFTDNAATNSNDPGWNGWGTPATAYSYNVAAVDTAGNEGPQAAQYAVYSYRNGKSNWSNNDLSYGTLSTNYSSTTGNPQGGAYDVSINFQNGGFQPAVAPPQAPEWDLEVGAFSYFTIDVNPGSTIKSTVLPFGTVSRLPPGDVYGWHPQVNIYDYGPAPVANKWATYKIPLVAVGMGYCDFTGSISGNKLTVTAIVNGQPLVDAGGFITGPGVPAGTYITAYDQASAIGTFTIAGPGISSGTHVASTKMSYQRTSLYKFGIQPPVQGVTMYFNNMGFLTN